MLSIPARAVRRPPKAAAHRVEDPLLPAARQFYSTGDLSAFFEAVSSWMVAYVGRRLNRDPDIVGDFYVHVYDHVPEFLRDYETRPAEVPFTAFFSVCLRNEFMNFIRPRRRAAPGEEEWSENMQPQGRAHHAGRAPQAAEVDQRRFSAQFYRRLDLLPLRLRLPVKLTHGLDPDRDELRELVRLSGGPDRASQVVCEFHWRREARARKLRRLEDRLAHLSYLIDSYARRPDLRGTPAQWSRWKGRVHRALTEDHPLFSLAELGALFGRNKSTMLRRVERALLLMRDSVAEDQEAAGR